MALSKLVLTITLPTARPLNNDLKICNSFMEIADFFYFTVFFCYTKVILNFYFFIKGVFYEYSGRSNYLRNNHASGQDP